jgi:hypothetical protein
MSIKITFFMLLLMFLATMVTAKANAPGCVRSGWCNTIDQECCDGPCMGVCPNKKGNEAGVPEMKASGSERMFNRVAAE